MKRLLAAGGVLALGATAIAPAAAGVRSVTVGSYYYEDATGGDGTISADPGDSIAFTFQGSSTHSATVDGLFDSGRKSAPQTYTTEALTRPGTYTLYCTVHGARQHSAVLVVRGASSSPSPSPTRSASASPRPKGSPTVGSRPRSSAPTRPTPTASTRPTASASGSAAPRAAAPPPRPSATVSMSSSASSSAEAVPTPTTRATARDEVEVRRGLGPVALIAAALVATLAGLSALAWRRRTR